MLLRQSSLPPSKTRKSARALYASMACSSGTQIACGGVNCPEEGDHGNEGEASTLGNARPVAAINRAPPMSRLHRSWRGAIKLMPSVDNAVPNRDIPGGALMRTTTGSGAAVLSEKSVRGRFACCRESAHDAMRGSKGSLARRTPHQYVAMSCSHANLNTPHEAQCISVT